MWLVIEEVEFESYYQALENPVALYKSRDKAEDEANRLRSENEWLSYQVVFVEVRG